MVIYDVYVNKKLFELGLKKSNSNKFCSICKESNNCFIKGDTDIFNSGKLSKEYWNNYPMFELFEVITFLTTKYNVMFLMENDSISLRIKIKDKTGNSLDDDKYNIEQSMEKAPIVGKYDIG